MIDPNNKEDRKKLEIQAEIEKRKKDILVQKATRELIESMKVSAVEKHGDNPVELNKILTELDTASSENEQFAKEYLKTTETEIKNATYNKVSDAAKEKYEERLKNRGLTDDEVHDKSSVGEKKVAISKPVQKTKKKTQKGEKKTEESPKNDKKIEKGNKMNDVSMEVKAYFDAKTDTFDPSTIPSNVQYDIIPLPSKGECYASKKSRIPVAYLTAADENIMASPNILKNGKIIEIILKRKILDKTINVEELCDGDIEAIVLWLRETAFGTKIMLNTTNPESGKEYKTQVDLSQFNYKEFNLKGDENGLFDYETGNGDKIKFRFLNRFIISDILSSSKGTTAAIEKENAKYCLGYISKFINLYNDGGEYAPLEEVEKIDNFINKIEFSEEDMFSTILTDTISEHTFSVNGNTDREYIKKYIENMKLFEFKKYRTFISENEPGVDTTINVEIPESDGGGSFETFLRIRDSLLFAD